MQLTTLPTPHSLPRQPQHVLTSLLDTLFEPCPQIHTIALSILLDPPFGSAFPTYDVVITVLHNAITKKLLEPSRAKDNTKVLDAFLSSHPRLGEKNAMMSALSRQEQEATCLYVDIFFRREGRGPEDKDWEFELTRLNLAYEEKFPGLRYVYVRLNFVKLLSKPFSVHGSRKHSVAAEGPKRA